MTLLELSLLAILRAIGSVWPLDAAGHDLLLKIARQASAFDRDLVLLAAELGLGLGLMLFYARDILGMGTGLVRLGRGKPSKELRILLQVLGASLPSLILIVILSATEMGWTLAWLTAASLIMGGVWLCVTDNLGITVKRLEHLTSGSVAMFGIIQTLSFLPGISRTATMIGLGRLLGFERGDCLRFTHLVLIPLALVHSLMGLGMSQSLPLVLNGDLGFAVALGAITALIGAAFLTRWLERHTFKAFGLWMIGFGIAAAVITAIWP